MRPSLATYVEAASHIPRTVALASTESSSRNKDGYQYILSCCKIPLRDEPAKRLTDLFAFRLL